MGPRNSSRLEKRKIDAHPIRVDPLAIKRTRGSIMTLRRCQRVILAAAPRDCLARLRLIRGGSLSAPRLLREPRPLRAPPLALVALTRSEIDRPVAALARLASWFLQPAEELVQGEVVADRVLCGWSVASSFING